MDKKITFTQATIAKLPAPAAGRQSYTDKKTPGLVLRVSSSGVKVFATFRRMGGKPTRLTIGRWPEIGVEQARQQAARIAGELASGVNPAEERRRARGETTVGELFGLYLEGHAKAHKRTWKADQEQFDRYLIAWKARKLSTIRRGDVAAWHAKIGTEHGPYSANRCLALLSSMFNFAAGLDYDGGNPAKGVKKFKEQSRDRFLRGDEIHAFFAALADEVDPWPDLFTLSLLTGARKSNVLCMKWADVELARGLWKISEDESKNKEPLVCILHPAAVEILQRRAETNAAKEKPSEYVFPSWGDTGHITETKTAWARITDRAKIKDIRLHDLRRTLGSWQAAAGASLSIIGRSLGHKSVQTTAVYARLDLDPVRASVDTAGDAIMAAANGDGKPKMLPTPTTGDTADAPQADDDKTPARKAKRVKANRVKTTPEKED